MYIYVSSQISSHSTVEIIVFLNILLVDERIRSGQIITDRDPGGTKTYSSYGSGSGSLSCEILLRAEALNLLTEANRSLDLLHNEHT